MNSTLVIGIMIAVALVLILAVIVVMIKVRSTGPDEGDSDAEEFADEDIDEEEDEDEIPSLDERRSSRYSSKKEESYDEAEVEDYPDEDAAEVPEEEAAEEAVSQKKRQWKIILENLDTWEKHSLIFTENIGFGRSDADSRFEKYVALPEDPRISKTHCAIIVHGSSLYVKDLDSRNGTFLNGTRLDEPVAIQKDDVITMGETDIEVKKIMREKL